MSATKARMFSPERRRLRSQSGDARWLRYALHQPEKTLLQEVRLEPNFRYYGSDASNNYNSLQMKLEKRFSTGLQLSPTTRGPATWTTAALTSLLTPLTRGPGDNNRAHAFMIALFGGSRSARVAAKGRRVQAGRLAGRRVAVNGVFNWASGLPFTPSYGPATRIVIRDGAVRISPENGALRIRASSAGSTPRRHCSQPTARPPVRGSGRSAAPGQCRTQRSMGAALHAARHVVLQDLLGLGKVKLQYRAEAFNFANHTNLGQPNGCVDCPGVAGRIFNAIGNYVPRQWQMALRAQF